MPLNNFSRWRFRGLVTPEYIPELTGETEDECDEEEYYRLPSAEPPHCRTALAFHVKDPNLYPQPASAMKKWTPLVVRVVQVFAILCPLHIDGYQF